MKSLDNNLGVAGVAGLPEASNINECDGAEAVSKPAEIAGNPAECRTSRPIFYDDVPAEIDRRLLSALHEAGRSALGMPSSVDTLKAMLAKAGFALVLA